MEDDGAIIPCQVAFPTCPSSIAGDLFHTAILMILHLFVFRASPFLNLSQRTVP
jgi:hypothetical protein